MKKIFCLLAAVLLLFSACGSDPVETPSTDATSTESSQEPQPDPTYAGSYNPLTGLPVSKDITKNRPYLVVLNNLKEALPQHGISKADILYEVPAEGGVTRMMALYQDISDVGVIGSVRSTRPYFLDIAQAHDAIFIHWGGSDQAYSDIKSRKIDNADGISDGNMFYRDKERQKTMATEHTGMTSGELIQKHIGRYNYRMTHNDYVSKMTFADDGAPAAGQPAGNVSVQFSSYKTGVFAYNETDGLYHVSQHGKEHKDGNTGTQLSVTNVLVLFARSNQIAGDDKGRLEVELTGSGTGYFACGGRYVPIKWQRSGASSQFVYTLEDGSPLVFGRGMTYVNIVPLNSPVTFS